MAQKGLTAFFDSFLNKKSFFSDKKVLQGSYHPETILHRDEQINQTANILAPALKLDKPSNLFVYGKTGTGKTLVVRYVAEQLTKTAQTNNIPLKITYINCKLKKITDTEYRLMAQLARELGKEIPATGLPTDEVYRLFFDALDEEKLLLIVVLDEIDQITNKISNEVLYNLTRINAELKKSQISLVGISNNLSFTETLDPRVKSSLSEEGIAFPPYNALQIQDILRIRAKIAFSEGALDDGVIEKCAAYAALGYGDARRALELLRVAGEIAEREGLSKVKIKHIDEAEDKIEHDRVLDIITTQPKQFKATLYSILSVYSRRKDAIFTGEAYEVYKAICLQSGMRPLTQRRVSDVIAELDLLGIIHTKVISKGRYGRTREISLAIPESSSPKLQKLLEEGLELS